MIVERWILKVAHFFKEAPASRVLIIVLLVIFCLQMFYRVIPLEEEAGFLHNATLLAVGGAVQSLVFEFGEWYRIFTAFFLHANPIHLLLNCYVLWYAGQLLEPLIGSAWTMAIFLLSGSISMMLSASIQPRILIVGASGGILGLLAAAALIFMARLPHRHEEGAALFKMVVLSIIPLSLGSIDYVGHIAGALVGLIIGFILQISWPAESEKPGYESLAWIISACIIGATVYGFYRIFSDYSAFVAKLFN